MTTDTTAFAERTLLPIVAGFAAGVLLMHWQSLHQGDTVTVTANDNLLIQIECYPDVADAPVWVAPSTY